MHKRVWIPIIGLLAAVLVLLSPAVHVLELPSLPSTGQSMGQLLHPSGNPFVNRFSDVKDIRTATYVVAASDSVHKHEADYYCNGTNDNVEIQAALDALPATGGSVVLLDGTYVLDAYIDIDSYQTIEGQGRNTILTTSGAFGALDATGGAGTERDGIHIYNLCVDGTAGGGATSDAIYLGHVRNAIVKNLWFLNCESGLWVDAVEDLIVSDCYGDTLSAYFAYIDSSFRTTIKHCSAYNVNVGVQIFASPDTRVLFNYFDCGFWGIQIGHANSLRCMIVGNDIRAQDDGIYCLSSDALISHNLVTTSTAGVGIYVDVDRLRCQILNNVVYACFSHGMEIQGNNCIVKGNYAYDNGGHGIWLWISDYSTVEGNYCYLNDNHGLAIEDSDHCLVKGNHCFENSQATDVTWANIWIDDSDYCSVLSNFCRQGAQANQPDYGLEILADSTKCLIANNDLYDAGQTANFIDGGTLTQVEDNNRGIEITDVKMYRLLKNTSGGQLVAGDVAVLKAVAAGNEFTTTVAADDEDVYGMVAETIADTASGLVLVKGKTTVLKVSGTVAIGIGDRLSTHDAAGIAQKAGTETAVCARALEAYAVDDDLGVIDAWVCSKWD